MPTIKSLHFSTTADAKYFSTLSTSMWLARAAPAVGPKPDTTFKTPAGSPACQTDYKLGMMRIEDIHE